MIVPFRTKGGLAQKALAMFSNGEQGVYFDPNNTATLFEDAAGTIPTALERPVGLMLDKSGRGNHAFNPSGNSANFPVLSARVNLLTKSEDFSDSVWVKTGCSATANLITENSSQGLKVAVQNLTFAASTYSLICDAKPNGRQWIVFQQAGNYAYFNLSGQGAVGITSGILSASISLQPDGYYTCTVNATATAGANNVTVYLASANGVVNYVGDGVSGVYVRKADLRVANDALNQPAYQRVNTATDYDTVGFKPYLSFNGVNQWLQTNSIDFTYGDKMFVSAGVRKLSSSGSQIVAELSQAADNLANNGCFYFNTNELNSGGSSWFLNGTSYTRSVTPAVSVPITEVNSVLFDFSKITRETETIARINGIQQTITGPSASEAGIGPFGNYPLYIGARAGTSMWFNGRLYQLVIAGKAASASEIASTEAYLNQKTGAY